MSSASHIRQILADRACTHNVTHAALSDLLKILKLHGLDVPLTAAGLLKTPSSIKSEQKSGGEIGLTGVSPNVISPNVGLPNVGSPNDIGKREERISFIIRTPSEKS